MTSPSLSNRSDELPADFSREHGKAVRGYLLAMVRRVDVAEDLTQEVFYRAWRARHRYHEQGNARAYLLRIADHLVCDRARRNGREVNLDEEDWKQVEPLSKASDPPATLLQREAVARLGEAMEKLSPLQQRVLLLRYYGRLSFSEIAQVIECPLNTTLSHCRRGLKTLRTILVENQS